MGETRRDYCVRAVRCHHDAGDEDVYRALKAAVDPLDRAWQRIAAARRVGLKVNQDWAPERVVMRHGHRLQLVSDQVVRALLRLLRERTNAELFVVDSGVEGLASGRSSVEYTTILPVLKEFDVPYVDGNTDRTVRTPVPDGGLLFCSYPLPASSVEADAFVSVQKVKNHGFMGVTLSLKNLFGLTSFGPEGRPRGYYHHLVRLPYVLADLGRIYDPVLNVLDGIVCQAGQEWGTGDHPRDCGVLIAGDQTVATDACAAHLMGHDAGADWPTPPFHRDRNALRVAADSGFGSVRLGDIDFRSEVDPPIGAFFAIESDPAATVRSWLRTTCEQALHYRRNRDRFVSAYAEKYILLQMGEVRWSSRSGELAASRRLLAGDHPEQALWLKYVDPDEIEGERFDHYETFLERFDSTPGAGGTGETALRCEPTDCTMRRSPTP